MTFANLSGGRDSTAMVIRFLELGEKIDIENMELYRLMIGDSNETN